MPPKTEKIAISEDEFGRLMTAAQARGPLQGGIALAVSGGPDSMAMAFCVKRWTARLKLAAPVALIVDHRLRAESEDEAQHVRDQLEKMGLFAEILVWDHPPLATRLHVAARKVRYELLREACARHEAATLFLAHHQDDQAETVLERFAKGSGTDGLAGMAPDTWQDGLRLLRPFLALPKTRLVATCETHAIPYVQDPSNMAMKYARGRLRRVWDLLEAEGFSVARLTDLANRAREDREALHFYAQNFLKSHVTLGQDGVLRLDRAAFSALPCAVAARALSRALHHIHETPHPHPRRHLMPLCEALAQADIFKPQTLSGCLITRGTRHIALIREVATLRETRPLHRGQTILWDGRWHVSLAPDCPETDLVVRALGVQPHDLLDKIAPDVRKKIPQGRARAALPALWKDGKLWDLPSFSPPLAPDPLHRATSPQQNSCAAIAFPKIFPIS